MAREEVRDLEAAAWAVENQEAQAPRRQQHLRGIQGLPQRPLPATGGHPPLPSPQDPQPRQRPRARQTRPWLAITLSICVHENTTTSHIWAPTTLPSFAMPARTTRWLVTNTTTQRWHSHRESVFCPHKSTMKTAPSDSATPRVSSSMQVHWKRGSRKSSTGWTTTRTRLSP